jgi:probable phosphoglycerate mutase
MQVLYIRHGQSETNLLGTFAGGKDNTPLTDLGRDQARGAGKELASAAIETIVASPLSRTHETAIIIANEIGLDPNNIKLDARFQEYDIGSGNGLPIEGMTAAKMLSLPGAEDPADFAARVKAGLQDVITQTGNVLIVGHGGVGRIIECLRTNRAPTEFYDIQGYPNAHAVELDLSWLRKA